MNKLLLVFVAGLAGAGIYFLFTRRREDEDQDQGNGKLIRPSRAAEVLSRYLANLQKDIEQYEKSTNYSYQFGLREEQRPYTRQVKPIANLVELGLNAEEVQDGNALLIEMARKETGGRPLDWGSSLVFLMDYTAAKARISALTSLYDQLTDKTAAGKLLTRLKQDKQTLIEDYR